MAGPANQVNLRCDWLPEVHFARSGFPAIFPQNCCCCCHVINPLLTKLVQPRWRDIGIILFLCVFVDRDEVEHEHATNNERRISRHLCLTVGQVPIYSISCFNYALGIAVKNTTRSDCTPCKYFFIEFALN